MTPNDRTFAATDIAAERGGRLLFHGLGFCLEPGETLVLTGPNGSGKSTLLRLAAGFGRPLMGAFAWNGQPVARDIDRHRARLHYLGHAEAIRPALTVAETLRFWQSLAAGDAATAVTSALDRFGMAPLAALPCRFLSAGQRRRLTLARLFAWAAPLWLLDEPTVGLDRAGIDLLINAIAQHRATGGIAILSTHQTIDLGPVQTLDLTDFPPLPPPASSDDVW